MEAVKGRKAHVLGVPAPAQGHVKPLIKFGSQIAKHGIKVTIVNIQSIHDQLLSAAKMCGEEEEPDDDNIILATIPDIPRADDQKDPFNMEQLRRTLPGSLMHLIQRINTSNPDEKISCLIIDVSYGQCIWETAQMIGVQHFVFSPSSAATTAMVYRVPKLIQLGLFDSDGNMIKKGEIVRLSDDIPGWGEDEFTWSFPSNRGAQKIFFEVGAKIDDKIYPSKWTLINTCYELEHSGCHLNPTFLPIGPLLETSNSCSNSSNFYPEDESCLSWLDDKPPGSVIYVSFGSVAVFSQQQLDELALGLELSGRAFLWVVRSDLANGLRATYPEGFLERVSEIGKIVGWAPQERVLSHPSVACFLSHCGWNSILEGTCKGVPFLCWPYFADQFHNQNYVCDKWETGLRISPDEDGIRSRHEIKKKIDLLFSNHNLKENALALKEACEKSVTEGGSSYKNLLTFVDHIRNSA